MRPSRRAIGVLAIALLLSACASRGDDASDPTTTSLGTDATSTTPTPPHSDRTFAQLCSVLDAARAGDLTEVRSSFDDGPLHTLAQATVDVDRAVAARLLEAKEAVEVDLSEPTTSTAQIAEDLQTLTDATAEARRAIGDPIRSTCEDTP